jgi:hypothetical protein
MIVEDETILPRVNRDDVDIPITMCEPISRRGHQMVPAGILKAASI